MGIHNTNLRDFFPKKKIFPQKSRGRGCRGLPVAKKRAAEAAEGFLGAKNGSAEAAAHFLWRKSVRQGLPRPKKGVQSPFRGNGLIYLF